MYIFKSESRSLISFHFFLLGVQQLPLEPKHSPSYALGSSYLIWGYFQWKYLPWTASWRVINKQRLSNWVLRGTVVGLHWVMASLNVNPFMYNLRCNFEHICQVKWKQCGSKNTSLFGVDTMGQCKPSWSVSTLHFLGLHPHINGFDQIYDGKLNKRKRKCDP